MEALAMATSSKGPSSEKPSKASPVPRAALRYIVSPQEYKVLHQYILSRSPTLQRNVPTVARYEAALVGKDHYNAAAVRATARVFVAAQTGLKAWELMSKVLFSRGKAVAFVISVHIYLKRVLTALIVQSQNKPSSEVPTSVSRCPSPRSSCSTASYIDSSPVFVRTSSHPTPGRSG